jgi:hypothetical protein
VEEEAVEGVRNAEGGTKRALGSPRVWTPPADVAMGDGTPREVSVDRATGAAGRFGLEDSEGEESAREDAPIMKVMGNGGRWKTARASRKR